MSSIFVFRGIDFFSFCNPSRGPTSTMRTWSEVNRASVAKRRVEGSTPVGRRTENNRNLGRKAMMKIQEMRDLGEFKEWKKR